MLMGGQLGALPLPLPLPLGQDTIGMAEGWCQGADPLPFLFSPYNPLLSILAPIRRDGEGAGPFLGQSLPVPVPFPFPFPYPWSGVCPHTLMV